MRLLKLGREVLTVFGPTSIPQLLSSDFGGSREGGEDK